MATSGSTNYLQNRNQLIYGAMELLGIYGIGHTVSAEDLNFFSTILNDMVKAWSAQGLHLWCKEEAILYLTPNTAKYTLDGSNSYCTLTSDQILTQLDGNLATSSTNVTVDDTTGMMSGDYIGIVLEDNTIHWTTINTVSTSTTLILASATTGAADDNAIVYTFTNKLTKPLRILSARLLNGYDAGATSSLTEFVLTPVAYQDYMEIPIKTSGGLSNQYMYNPKSSGGDFYLWPRPDNGNYRVAFTFERVLEDLDNATDDFDFPPEWLAPLKYQLAVWCAPAFGKEDKVAKLVQPMASSLLENLKNWDCEITTVKFQPSYRYRR